jgi:hypothetical protein
MSARQLAPVRDLLRKHPMPAEFSQPSVNGIWRAAPEPGVAWRRARLHTPARRRAQALFWLGAAMLAVPVVVFLRIVLTAPMAPRWQAALVHVFPFLDW